MFILRDDDSFMPTVITPKRADRFEQMQKNNFYLNFTSARNSDEEYIPANFKPINIDSYQKINNPNWKFTHWNGAKYPIYYPPENDFFQDEFFNAFGRRRACKSKGLTGAEKRACVQKLRQAGWKKGQPIPPDFTVDDSDIKKAEQELQQLKQQEQKAGLSTGAKIGIAVAVFGIAGFAIWSAMSAIKPKPTPLAIPIRTSPVKPIKK